MKSIYTIYGSGGYAREVMPILRDYVDRIDNKSELYFIDDFSQNKSIVNNIEVITPDEIKKIFPKEIIYCSVAIANNKDRKNITLKCNGIGFKLVTLKSSNSLLMDSVEIGEGSIISPFVTITSNVLIGKSFHANIYSYVGHDCIVGDYVTFAPAVKCNGNVRIESGAYLGTGAIIYPGTNENPIVIGKNSKVAAGSVVTKNVPDNTTVFGNPAQVLTREIIKKMKEND